MSQLKNFKINGLFSVHDVSIPFDTNVKILIGENGLGKTTILNSLYYLLTKKWSKLVKIEFDSMELVFSDNSVIFFYKKQLEAFLLEDRKLRKRGNSNFYEEIKRSVNLDELKELVSVNSSEEKYNYHDLIYNYIVNNKINKNIGAPVGYVVEVIYKLIFDDFAIVFNDIIWLLDNHLDTTILYFPTYRRVEEDLQNLGHIRRIPKQELNRAAGYEYYDTGNEIYDIEEETLIQFGMEDVNLRINKVLKQINDSSITGFSKVTADILSQMLRTFPEVTEESLAKLNKADIEIILNRVQNNLSEFDRNNILGIVESKSLSDKPDLVFFLNKLLDEIYYKQKELDNNIKRFVTVCNSYLVEKSIIFDESLVTIEIRRTVSKQKVEFNQLSSGEKQIVSLFSKIYLEKTDKLTVLFDEPELSLSILWQRQLLPDIVNSGKCDMLLAVTHSPFVFNNELEEFAVGMNIFIN